MPRLYNWIRGEGMTKAQRWGLSAINVNSPNFGQFNGYAPLSPTNPSNASPLSTNYVASPLSAGDLFQAPYGSSGPGDPNYIDPLAASSYATFDQLVPFLSGNTLGSWIQANGTMLLVGGVALLFLMKRR